MPKTYTINGVQVSYDVFQHAMYEKPDDFSDSNNIDAPDIPKTHKDAYARDRWNESMGRGMTFWTPRRRMLDSLERKAALVQNKKEARLKRREAKMEAFGNQRAYEEELADHANLVSSHFANLAAQQESEDKKSVLLFIGIFCAAFLFLVLLAYAI